jgi:cysteinyl-tRNA synthetase
MALDLLGEGFDLHGGGQDLAFPHHENERAQAVALGKTFAVHWAHNGFVETDGEKMSKSLGNFTNLLDLVESVDPRAYRMLCLQAHYRSPFEVTAVTVGSAESSLGRLDGLARRLSGVPLPEVDPQADLIDGFRERMDDDLDTPGAMALVFTTITRINTALDAAELSTAAGAAAALWSMLEAVGLDVREVASPDDVPDAVAQLAAARDAARAARDWAGADSIRDELTAAGWIVEDGVDGTAVRRH